MALNNYWEQHPPVHLLVAAYVGFDGSKAPASQAAAPAPEQDLSELVAIFQQMGGTVNL